MIHYHGLPITPATCAVTAINGGHAFVSYRHPDQLSIALDCASTFAVDNGAFSAWRAGTPVTDWKPYYEWVGELHLYPSFDFAVIPDVIDGDEKANDDLIKQWPWIHADRHLGAPVWHLHESLERLSRLVAGWPRICLGSSGEYAKIGTQKWWNRMNEAFNTICRRDGLPVCKVHGLRMLDPAIVSRYPFSSCDSTSIGRNIGFDSIWVKSIYTPPTKEARTLLLRQRFESSRSPIFWDRKPAQINLMEAA